MRSALQLRVGKLVLIGCLAGCVGFAGDKRDKRKDPEKIGDRDVGKGVNFYSVEKEIALGKQMAQEVEQQAQIVDDPVIEEYVSRVGQNLVRNSDAKVPFNIKVVDTDEVNAFALPGGFCFVNSGLILKADADSNSKTNTDLDEGPTLKRRN